MPEPQAATGDLDRDTFTLIKLSIALLIGLGVSLLALGTLLADPYVRSRMWRGPDASHVSLPGDDAVLAELAPRGEELPTLCGESCVEVEPDPGAGRGDEAVSVAEALPEPLVPTRLGIPKLGVDAAVMPVGSSTEEIGGRDVRVWDVPDGGHVGWHQESALLGAGGNTVLNGHNTTGGEVFRDLFRLEPGDTITAYSELEPYRFIVSATLVLPEAGQSWNTRLRNAEFLETTADERLTLVTCHPYGSIRNRLIVISFPAEEVAD